RRRLCNPRALDLHSHAQLASSAHRRLRPRDRFRDALVVDRAFLAQPGDRVLDRARLVTFSGEALTDLQFGELAPREHLETVDVGVCHRSPPGADATVSAAEPRDFRRRTAAGAGLGHLVAAQIAGLRDALHPQLELVYVARLSHAF